MNLESGTVIDRYTIEGRLGNGGMAVVYRARHNQLGTLHAIKVLLMPAQAVRERLLQEGRVQATLRHPNIVTVTDVIEVGGSPGLVMELVEGPSLDALLAEVRLTVEQADELARGILAGVAEAHRYGLIHRDLKPANVLLQARDHGFVPKVMDFGLAKILTTGEGPVGTQTRSGMAMGTPCYMAPEQIRSARTVDKRADVFSLGALLYEMVTGERAFDGPDLMAIFTRVTEGRYNPVTDRAPEAPDRIVRAIAAALEVDREKRVPDCDTLLRLWMGQATPSTRGGAWSADLLRRSRPPVPVIPTPEPSGPATWDPAAGILSVDDAATDERPAPAPPGAVATTSAPAVVGVAPSAPPSTDRATSAKGLGRGALIVAVLGAAATFAAYGSGWFDRPATPTVEVDATPTATTAQATAAPSAPAVPIPDTPTGRQLPRVLAAASGTTPTTTDDEVAAASELPAPPLPPPRSSPTPPPTHPAVVATSALSKAQPPTVAPSPAPAVVLGTLRVNSQPWSTITLDGVAAGRTGTWKRDLSAGPHTVVLTTTDGRNVSKPVTVPADSETAFCWSFDLDAACPQ